MKRSMGIMLAALLLAMSMGARAQAAESAETAEASAPEVLKQICEEPQLDGPLLQIDLGSQHPGPSPDPKSGLSLVYEGGGFTNRGFPALSADGSQIAILRDPTEVMEDTYPVFEFYSTANLRLQKRIDLNSEREKQKAWRGEGGVDLKSPESLEDFHQGLDEVRRILDHGAFRALPRWYDKLWYYNKLPWVDENISNSAECRGYRLIPSLDPDTDDNLIQIISLASGKVTFSERLPVIEVYKDPENPHNDCSVQGSLWDAWYVPEAQIAVMRLMFNANYCGMPERWIVTRY